MTLLRTITEMSPNGELGQVTKEAFEGGVGMSGVSEIIAWGREISSQEENLKWNLIRWGKRLGRRKQRYLVFDLRFYIWSTVSWTPEQIIEIMWGQKTKLAWFRPFEGLGKRSGGIEIDRFWSRKNWGKSPQCVKHSEKFRVDWQDAQIK